MGAAEPTPRLWTREEYYKMAEAGIFRPGERRPGRSRASASGILSTPLYALSRSRLGCARTYAGRFSAVPQRSTHVTSSTAIRRTGPNLPRG
jgi:hypothetical protein